MIRFVFVKKQFHLSVHALFILKFCQVKFFLNRRVVPNQQNLPLKYCNEFHP